MTTPSVREALQAILDLCGQPNPANPLDYRVMPGNGKAFSAAVKNGWRALTAPDPVLPETQEAQALRWATELAVSMARKFYPEVPQFRPLPDLVGVISQIDNMSTGLARATHPPAAQASAETVREALQNPEAVHVAMLRGEIAKPSLRSMLHVYGAAALDAWDWAEAIANHDITYFGADAKTDDPNSLYYKVRSLRAALCGAALAQKEQAAPAELTCPHCTGGQMLERWVCPNCCGTLVSREQMKRNDARGAQSMKSNQFNARSDAARSAGQPGQGDDVPCVKCGAKALDTGLECDACGHDNYEAVTGAPFHGRAALAQKETP